jgi:hypothetical protein
MRYRADRPLLVAKGMAAADWEPACIYESKNPGAHANAEREGHNRDTGNDWMLQEWPNAELEVLQCRIRAQTKVHEAPPISIEQLNEQSLGLSWL